MHIRQKQTIPPRKTNNNHICSHYSDNPMTTTNSVNFRTNSHLPQDHSENYPFFQQMMTDFMTKAINKIFKTKDSSLIT